MSTSGNSNEVTVYKSLVSDLGLSTAQACAILANIEHESSFNPQAEGDGGTSYGLCQWHEGRKQNLINFCNQNGFDYSSIKGQIYYLKYELENGYTSVWNSILSQPNTAQGAYNGAYVFCTDFERPADATTKARARGDSAQNTYFPYYSSGEYLTEGSGGAFNSGSITDTEELELNLLNKGQRIVQVARGQVGKYYADGGRGPSTYDSAGLVYYCYNTVGVSISNLSPKELYNKYVSTAKVVTDSSPACGDLLFYRGSIGSTSIDYVAIANGVDGKIYASKGDKVIEDSLGSPAFVLRILSDAETSQGAFYESDITGNSNYYEVATQDVYADTLSENLSRVSSVGYDYGYLIDLTNGGEFKFHLPDSYSESAGANWGNVDITGRSVSVLHYEGTSSRKTNIKLDLYAGTGVYRGMTGDLVGILHNDINFVKSLEYPDYTNPISRPPAEVQLILGSHFSLRGVVSDVDVEHLKPLDSQNRSMYVKLSFTVTQTAPTPPDYTDVRVGRLAAEQKLDISTEGNTWSYSMSTNAPAIGGSSSNSNSNILDNTNTNIDHYRETMQGTDQSQRDRYINENGYSLKQVGSDVIAKLNQRNITFYRNLAKTEDSMEERGDS